MRVLEHLMGILQISHRGWGTASARKALEGAALVVQGSAGQAGWGQLICPT